MRLPGLQLITQKSYSKSELLNFYQQLLALLKAGIPITKSLQILLNQSNKRFKIIISKIIDNLQEGNSLAVSFEKAGLPSEDYNLIRVGEESGRLPESLSRIIKYLAGSLSSKDKIKKALMYPVIVLSLSFCSVIFLLVFILPTFKGIFSEFNFDLPFLTRVFLGISEQWFPIFVSIVLFASFFCFLFRKEEVRMRLPLVGSIYKNTIYAKICRSLGYQLKSAVPILKAIATIREGLASQIYSGALDDISQSLEHGERISDAMEKTAVFPYSLIQIVSVGEESGSLDEVLIQSAEFYEQETEGFIKKWVTLIEPISTLAVGGLVGLIAFAMILPLFKMMESIQ